MWCWRGVLFGRVFGFFQRPKSSSRWFSHPGIPFFGPGSTVCLTNFRCIPTPYRQVLARPPTKYDILHLSFQLVSQDSTQELSQHIFLTYPGVSPPVFLSFAVYGFDLLVTLLFVLIVLVLESPGLSWWLSSTNLVFPPYLFFYIYYLPEWRMMSDSLYNFTSFRTHHSFSVTF